MKDDIQKNIKLEHDYEQLKKSIIDRCSNMDQYGHDHQLPPESFDNLYNNDPEVSVWFNQLFMVVAKTTADTVFDELHNDLYYEKHKHAMQKLNTIKEHLENGVPDLDLLYQIITN